MNKLKARRRRGPLDLVGGALLAGLAITFSTDTGFRAAVRGSLIDTLQRAAPRETPSERRVVVVDIDEASLVAHGQWPWPRNVMASLVTELGEAGAAVIALDVAFPEADRTSPDALAAAIPGLPASVIAALRATPRHDDLLAAALAATPSVLGMGASPEAAQNSRPLPGARVVEIDDDPRPFLPRLPGLVRNLPELERAASGIGLFSPTPEADGVVRRLPILSLAPDGSPIPFLAIEALRVATGEPSIAVRTGPGGLDAAILGGIEIPLDAHGRLWIRYARRDPSRTVPAHAVLSGTADRGLFRDAIVFVGTSAVGLQDIRATPVDGLIPGVEVHAQAVDALLDGATLQRPAWAPATEIALLLILCSPAAIFGSRARPLHSAALLGGGLVVAGAVTWLPFTQAGLIIDGSAAGLSLVVVHLATGIAGHFRAERSRGEVRRAFAQYLAPALVEQLVADPSRLRLGGETKDLTIMFADVRGFTALSESMKDNPERLVETINALMTELSDAILAEGGTIDKFLGDAVMAFWNAPLDVPDHPDAALRAAAAMTRKLASLNSRFATAAAAEGRPFTPLGLGIGVNTGRVVVGNVGGQQRFDYSALGDPVNLASRLEGQCKTYAVPCIVGGATIARLTCQHPTIEIDLLRVKGKSEPVEIHALLDDALLDAPMRMRHANLMAAYKRQEWETADRIAASLGSAPGMPSGLYDLFQRRISAYRTSPPEADWDGSHTAHSK